MSVIQEICDRVAIIDGGLIAEEGGVEEIFRAPKTKIGQELVTAMRVQTERHIQASCRIPIVWYSRAAVKMSLCLGR